MVSAPYINANSLVTSGVDIDVRGQFHPTAAIEFVSDLTLTNYGGPRRFRLGRSERMADNARMSMQSGGNDGDDASRGFQFPGDFEITAMGPAQARLDQEIPRLLTQAGLTVLHETARTRPSSAGRFVSVTISFRATSREDYEAAHRALRAHPEVKWTL